MADFTDQNIQDTYQRVVQIDNGQLQDGTGSVILSSTELSSIQAIGDSNAITSTEWAELKNIGSAEISSTEWGYVASMQDVSLSSTPTFNTLSLKGQGASASPILSFTGPSGSINNPQIGVPRGGAMFFHSVEDPSDIAITFINQNGVLAATIDNNGTYRSLLGDSIVELSSLVTLSSAQTITGVKTIGTNKKLQFRDSGIYLNSNTDGTLQIVSDNKVNIFGNIVRIYANLTASGDISSSGTLIANEVNIIGHITASGNISASGTATVNTLVAAGLSYPTTDGDANQIIITDGAGNLTFSNNSSEATHVECKNTSGGTLTKGTPVYITGTVGTSTRLEVAAADASDPSKMPAVGVLESDLANNAEGFVAQGGYLRQLATATIDGTSTNSNDTIYVKAGGGLTMTKPTGANLIQNIAKVARSHASAGSIIVSSILRTNDVPNFIECAQITASGDISASGNIKANYIETAKIPLIQYISDDTTSAAQGRVLAAGSHDNATDSFALEWSTPLFEDTDFFETGSVSPTTAGAINNFAVKQDGRYEINCNVSFHGLSGARPGINLGIFTSSNASSIGDFRPAGPAAHAYVRVADPANGSTAAIPGFVIQLNSGSAVSMKVDLKDAWGGIGNTIWSGSLSHFSMKKIG